MVVKMLSKVMLCCIAVMTVISCATAEQVGETTSEKLYPPYPDVWHRKIEEDMGDIYRIRAFPLPNGEVLLVYMITDKKTGEKYSISRGFFSGESFGRDETRTIVKSISDFSEIFSGHKNEFVLSDGTKLIRYDRTSARCYSSFGVYMDVIIPGSTEKMRKQIRYRPDKPRFIPESHCEGNEKDRYEEERNMYFYVLPLADGTFLIFDNEYGNLVIRLTNALTSKSPLFGDELSILDIVQPAKNTK